MNKIPQLESISRTATLAAVRAPFSVEFEEPKTDAHRWARPSLPMPESIDGRLAALDQVGQLTLSHPGGEQFVCDFLGIHPTTLSRLCLTGQHQSVRDSDYIRDMKTLAERLIWARNRKGLSQASLAKLSGVTQSTIGNLESGLRKSARRLANIATALDVDALWLSEGRGPANASRPSPQLVDDGAQPDQFDRLKELQQNMNRTLDSLNPEVRLLTVYRLAHPDDREVIDSAIELALKNLGLSAPVHKRQG